MDLTEALAALPSRGWVKAPSPLTALPALAKHLGLESLTVKRDDLLDALYGGNKTRKLDVLLATAPFEDAPKWASLGAIGSGHLAACTAAAQTLGRELDAHLFFEPLSSGVLENLAFVASGPATLHYYGSRIELGVKARGLLTSESFAGNPVMPPGGTLPAGVAGVARAGFELREQIRANVNGLFYEPGDIAALRIAIARLAQDDLLRARFAHNARAVLDGLPGYDDMVAAYADVLREACAAPVPADRAPVA